MDPRIQSRRIDVMRAKGRRRLRLLLLIIAVLSLGVGGYFLSKSSLFDVDERKLSEHLSNNIFEEAYEPYVEAHEIYGLNPTFRLN